MLWSDFMQEAFYKYQAKYPERPRLCAAKLIVRNIKYIVNSISPLNIKLFNRAFKVKSDKINVLFILNGGLGDILIALNYLVYFNDNFNNMVIDIAVAKSFIPSVKVFLNGHNYIRNIIPIKEQEYQIYDLIINLTRHPIIVTIRKKKKIKSINNRLFEWLHKVKKFNVYHNEYNKIGTCSDGLLTYYSIIHNQNRLTQADIFNEFDIKTKFKITVKNDVADVLRKFDLQKDKYILLQGGTGMGSGVPGYKIFTRDWDVANFDKLVEYLKQDYPDYKFVQIGYDNGARIKGTECLLGKTSFEELLAIVDNAKLLISTESGPVHFRHFMSGKPSVVLFGPTIPEVYGYPENINIKSKICVGCEWMHMHWREKCFKSGISESVCMKALTPEMVFAKIKGSKL